MKVISVVSVVLLTACAVYGNPLGPVKDASDLDDTELVRQNREAPENYEPVGCYSFGKPLKKLKIFGKKPFKKTKASGNPLVQCITAAKDNDYAVIGIQKIKNKIICRGGNVNEVQLKPGGVLEKYKLDQKKCKNGVGSKKSILIYRKKSNPGNNQQCEFEGKLFKEGDESKKYNETENELNAYCQVCECREGEFRDCLDIICEVGFLKQTCAFGIHHPPENCCPVCKPSNIRCNGKKEWFELNGDDCLYCKCSEGCEKVQIYCPPVSCKNPVIREGTCCPYCEPRATTTQASFTIPLTTEHPSPAFPFPFDSNEDQEH